ncbi:28908_t:CDS:2, partial [Racocetra persica]
MLAVQSILILINPYVHSLQILRDNSSHTASLKLCENTSTGEIATIIYTNNTVNISPRSIIIWHHSDSLSKFINILSSQYEPLQYLLLFPHRTPGWHPNNCYNLSQIDWYRCHLLHEQRFLIFRRLTSEYLVDISTTAIIEDDFEDKDDRDKKKNLHLPASFLGSKRWCSTRVANALALA